jgi:hypothetical protein
MGLLVAGITGGASLIETARLTSLKREVDDLNRDLFTFYSKIGRLPGDFDNSGQIGFWSTRSCVASNFPSPYYSALSYINKTSCPFIDLYLHEISTFEPLRAGTDAANAGGVDADNIITKAKNYFVAPFSKTYKDFVLAYRTMDGIVINIFMTEAESVANKKTIDIAKKLETKFDDGVLGTGNIRGYCTATTGNVGAATDYNVAVVCSEMFLLSNVK